MSRSALAAALRRLEEKYRTLAALRERREEVESVGLMEFSREEAASRTEAFRRVAREFPGALRELDLTEAAVLRAKRREVEAEIEALRKEPQRRSPERAWVVIVLDYHATLREALAVKLWLARRLPRGGAVTPELAAEFRRWHARLPHRHGVSGEPDTTFLERHRRPPGGRLHGLVWEALERRHGLSRAELERAVFGPLPEGGRARRGRASR